MAKCEVLKPFILSWEGGYANVKGDRGGATNRGVTLATFRSVYGSKKTVDDLKALTDAQWMHIYKVYFWDRWRADDIKSQSVANILVDWMWASGVTGVRKVQKMLGVAVDGVVGPKTIAAVNGCDPMTLFDRIKMLRTAYINAIAVGEQVKFKRGWSRRLAAIQWGKLVCNGGKEITF